MGERWREGKWKREVETEYERNVGEKVEEIGGDRIGEMEDEKWKKHRWRLRTGEKWWEGKWKR